MRAGFSAILGVLFVSLSAFSQNPAITGIIHGTVTIEPSSTAARNAVVTIAELKRSVLTDENGAFEFKGIPSGKYQLFAHLDRVPDVIKTVEVTRDDLPVDFQLSLTPVSEQVTVTASGSAEAVGSSYQSVTSVGALELGQRNPLSIGEALEYQSGIAKRSFGPGSGRPVIRGFDGDRVLVLQDGLRVGGIASQSADEVEPIDVLSLDRVEIVKGPAHYSTAATPSGAWSTASLLPMTFIRRGSPVTSPLLAARITGRRVRAVVSNTESETS